MILNWKSDQQAGRRKPDAGSLSCQDCFQKYSLSDEILRYSINRKSV